jgi:riboflavin synthase
MFTGIIQEVGLVRGAQHSGDTTKLQIETKTIAQPILGESIAVNGTCLTVSRAGHDWFEADVMPKTWECTNLSILRPRDFVNLERALRAGDALGGHMVSGHVDGLGTIRSIKFYYDPAPLK